MAAAHHQDGRKPKKEEQKERPRGLENMIGHCFKLTAGGLKHCQPITRSFESLVASAGTFPRRPIDRRPTTSTFTNLNVTVIKFTVDSNESF